jgi:hypothetical protein
MQQPNICIPSNFFDNTICRKAKLDVDSGIIEPSECISKCSAQLSNCENSSIQYFCTRQPEIQHLYTFHPDPILYKWQLGNRNWAGPNHTYINAMTFDPQTNPTHEVKASACIYDSMGHGNSERHYSRSYNYLTRIKIKPGSLPLTNTNYEKAEDCACTEMKNQIPGIQNNTDSPGYSVCPDKPNFILNSPWVSLSQNWIDKNISEQDFLTTYLTTNDQNWFDPKYGFKTELNGLCESPSVVIVIQFRSAMDSLLDQHFFSATKGVPVELVTPTNYPTLPNFCTGANLNQQLKSNCEINISSEPPPTPSPKGYIGWGCADSGYCEPATNYIKFNTIYPTLKQCVDASNCSYQGGSKTCGCSDQCQLTNYNRCYDLYQQNCKNTDNCLQCLYSNPELSKCSDFITKYVCN